MRENFSKSTKITITACKFSKIFRGSTPLEPFLFFNQLQISFAEKKNPWKNVEIMAPSPFAISRYATADDGTSVVYVG